VPALGAHCQTSRKVQSLVRTVMCAVYDLVGGITGDFEFLPNSKVLSFYKAKSKKSFIHFFDYLAVMS
jgi:hypothetical protein